MSDQLVTDIVLRCLGEPPLEIRPRSGGLIHKVYEVQLARGPVIVRLNANARLLSGTSHNLAILSELGLPVPRLLANELDPSTFGVAFVILERIPGVDLGLELDRMTNEQISVLADRIVAAQRKVGRLPRGRGYGYVPIGQSAPYPSWQVLLLEEWERHLTEVPGWMPYSMRARVKALIDRLAPYFYQIPSVCFLDDITTKNIMVQQGELQGLVDFDWVGYGDPLDMVGLTKLSVLLNCGEQGNTYVQALCKSWGVPAALHPVIDAYAVIHAPCFVRERRERGDDQGDERVLRVVTELLRSAELGNPRGMRAAHVLPTSG